MFPNPTAARYPNQQQQNSYQGFPNHQMPPPQYPPPNYQGVNHPQSYLQPHDPGQNPQRGSIKGNNYQYPGKSAMLMQPPALNLEEPMDTNSQFFPQRGPMTMSNNQHSEFDTYHQQQEDPMWTHEDQIASMFWQQRCMTMLQRFEWFYERFQILRNQHLTLSEEMQKMDSQQEWHVFQQHHEEFHEKIQEMEQELSAVLGQNEQLLQQRRSQDSESVWEQRYQQLLGNFKSLQEEMAHMQSSGGPGGVPPEQFRQLEQHCAELEYQYEQAYNELKMHREGGISAEMEHQMNSYMEQIQSYKEKLNSLHGQNVQLQKMLEEYEGENEQLKQERYKSNIERNKFEDLMHQVEDKEQEIHSLQEEFKNRSVSQANVSLYEQTIQEKNREIQDLKKLISQKNNQINLSNSRLEQAQKNIKVKARDQLEQQRKNNKSKALESEQQISSLKLQLEKLNEIALRNQNLEKKLTYSNQEVANLNDTLKKKNQELIELRSLTYEVEKLKQAQGQHSRTVEERDRLADLVKKKNQEIEKMHIEIEKLNALINEISCKRQEYSTRNLRSQIQDLTDQLRRNEGQINRLKGLVNMKEEYSLKLQEQLRQTRQKSILVEQVLESQRETWREKQIKLSAKSHDYSQRIRELDYEFNLQMKDTLERQIVTLRKQNSERQEAIRALEQKELILQSQLSVFLKHEDNYSKDIFLQRQKQRQLLSSIEFQSKRFKELELIIKSKDEEILSNQKRLKEILDQSSSLNLQIEEHEKLIKAKSRTIKELQQQLQTSVAREGEAEKLVIQNAQLKITIQSLEREKAKEESLLAKSKGLSANNSKKNLESQQNAIAQLLKENEFQKAEIDQLLNKQYDQAAFFSKDGKSATLDLNRRLNEFNQRLHVTIASSPNFAGQLLRSESEKSMVLWQKERNQLINHYQATIQGLKEQLEGKRLRGSQVSNNTGLANSKKLFIGGLQVQRQKEEIAFLRQKSSEQEERNMHLIKVNEELKGKIDSMLKIKQNTSTLDYYKGELQRNEAERELLKEKLKRISEENRQYKLQLASKNAKLAQEYEFKVMQLELKIQEQQRKITLLHGEKAAASNEKASYEHEQNIRTLSKNPIQKKDEVAVAVTSKSSQGYKQGIQLEMGQIMGSYQSYAKYDNSPKYSVNISGSGVRGSRHLYKTDYDYRF